MSRSLDDLHPYLCELALKFIENCSEIGIKVSIVSTKRTLEEQEKLYAIGRTTDGSILTYKKPGTSLHEYGFAFDVVCNSTSELLKEESHILRVIAKIGKDIGLCWGGLSLRECDMNHFFWTGDLTLSDIKNGKLPKSDGTVEVDKETKVVIVRDIIKRREYIKKITLTDTTVRELPDPNSEVVGIIPFRTVIRTYRVTRNGYIEIEFNGRIAFIGIVAIL